MGRELLAGDVVKTLSLELVIFCGVLRGGLPKERLACFCGGANGRRMASGTRIGRSSSRIAWCAATRGCLSLWQRYMQLTEAEWAFRITRDELEIRPLWHQKEDRVKAHILV